MPPQALVLLLIAAALHTGWNLLIKRSQEKQLFAWWALVVGVVCFAPALLLAQPLPEAVWPYLVASAIVEAVYFIALTRAYQQADFSLVYPLARGTAPALLALWAVLFLGERPTPEGLAGLVLLVLGLLVVAGPTSLPRRGAVHASGTLLALFTALCISVYGAIDGYAMRLAEPLPYLVALLGLTAGLTAPAVIAYYGRTALAAQWRAHWRRIVFAGVVSMATYALVLQVYALVPQKVIYAGAVREISIVFAALAGWRWLGEAFGAIRTLGAALIFLGILLIALAG
jgi:drug/metabolite transporter (DMT)-like permease